MFKKKTSTTVKKEKKQKPRKQIKKFLSFEAYYPDLGIFETAPGSYCKAWYLDGIRADTQQEYEKAIQKTVVMPEHGSSQICHLAGKDMIAVTVMAGSVEEAEKLFQDLQPEGLNQITMRDWFNLIAHAVQFQDFAAADQVGEVKQKRKKIRPAAKLLPKIQPFLSKMRKDADGKKIKSLDPDILDLNDQYVRTVLLTNLPDYIYPSMLTEILRLSDKIITSLFLRRVDVEKCLYAIKNYPVQLSAVRRKRMTERLQDERQDHMLCQACLLVSVYGETIQETEETIKKIQAVAARFVCDITALEYQQSAALKSMAPLGKCFLSCYTVIRKNQISGLTPLSWSRYMSNGICYGTDRDTGLQILYNRIMAKSNGFILGSNKNSIQGRIIKEIGQIKKENPDIRIALLTMNSDSCTLLTEKYGTGTVRYPLISGDWEIDKEILTAVTRAACGNNGNLSKIKKEAMRKALSQPVTTWEEYQDKLANESETMAGQIKNIISCTESIWTVDSQGCFDGVTVYECGVKGARYAENIASLIQAAAYAPHDVVYVLSTEALSATNIIRICQNKNVNTLYTWTTLAESGVRRLYFGRSATEIEQAGFLDILFHNISDRVALRSILEFNRIQDDILASPLPGRGVLTVNDNTYTYKESDAVDGQQI